MLYKHFLKQLDILKVETNLFRAKFIRLHLDPDTARIRLFSLQNGLYLNIYRNITDIIFPNSYMFILYKCDRK